MTTEPVDVDSNSTDQSPIVTASSLLIQNTTLNATYAVTSSAFYESSQEMNTTVLDSSVKDLPSTVSYLGSVEKGVSHVDPLSNGTFSPDSYLDLLNEEFADSIWPAIVFIVVLMVMGLIGNVYVLYVYSKNNCNRTIIRFIQALAVFDLLSCAIAMPGEILDMTRNYTFGNSGLCPTFRTVNLFCTMASGATLVVVAIDRYRRICSPLESQIKPRTAGLILLGLSIVCLVLSSPSAIVFGSKSVPTTVNYINGSDCSISDNVSDTPLPLAFNGFQFLLFLIGAVALVIIYSLIARTILHQAKQRKKRNRQRRRSLKNGGGVPLANNRSDVSSPSSPTHNPKRPFFKYPDAVLDNVLDLSDVMPSMKGPPNTVDGDAKAEIYSKEVEDSSDKPKQAVAHSTRASNPRKGAFTFPRSISVTSSTSGIDVDITSNATVSPPDTPIDRLELVSLLKHKAPTNARLISQLKRHSADKVNGHNTHIKECSDSIPANSSTCIDQNANKQTINNANLMLGQVSNEKEKDDILKPEADPILADDATVAAKVESGEEESGQKKRTRSLDGFDQNEIVLREKKDQKQTSEESEMNHHLQGHGMSLLLPPPKRKVVFRSSSLGHEDTKNRHRPQEYNKASRPLDLDSEIPETPLRRRRLSSFRGLKELRRLTLSEYQGTVRTTSMLFVITLIYILSFLPHLVLMTFKAIGDENDTWLVASNIILRSYFINSVANPIIYSFCSRNFFSQCRNPSGQSGTLTR